jgi:hypothetical protein
MNILEAIQTLKDNQSVTVKHGVLSRHDVGDKAYYTMTYPNGLKVEDWILVHMLQQPAYVLELIWGLEYHYEPSKSELLAWLREYKAEMPSVFRYYALEDIANYILQTRPCTRASVSNHMHEYLYLKKIGEL